MARRAIGLLLAVLVAAVFLPPVGARAVEGPGPATAARCQASEKIAREISEKIEKRQPVKKAPPFIAEIGKMCEADRMRPIVVVVVKSGKTFEVEYDPYCSEFIYENKHSIDLPQFLCKYLSGVGANDPATAPVDISAEDDGPDEHPKKDKSVLRTDNPKKDEGWHIKNWGSMIKKFLGHIVI